MDSPSTTTVAARAVVRGVLLLEGLLAAGVLVGCAQQAAPPGGPIDDTAPAIAVTVPELLAVNVPLDTPLSVTFTERVDRSRAEDAIVVRPAVTWARRGWEENTLRLEPSGGWAANTTYSVLFRTAITDARDIAMKESALIVFSTGPEVPAGRVAGMVRRLDIDGGAILVFAFPSEIADTTDVDLDAAIAVTEPDGSGAFILAGLPVGEPVEVGAFLDLNENRGFDPARDLYCRARSAVVPDSSGGPLDVDIPLVFADTPGFIRAVVRDSVCLELDAIRREGAGRRDSLFAARDSLIALRATWEARIDSLMGAAVAPEDETVDDPVITPPPPAAEGEPTAPEAPEGAVSDSLRAEAERLKSALGALAVPDSAAIAALPLLPPSAAADSAYCRAPLVLRFEALADTTRVVDIQYERSEFDVADVAAGAYRGVVWRDLNADESFDPATEPGTGDPITIWVPPGEAGVVDTLRFSRDRDANATGDVAPRDASEEGGDAEATEAVKETP